MIKINPHDSNNPTLRYHFELLNMHAKLRFKPMAFIIDKTIKVTVSDTVFLDKENERING